MAIPERRRHPRFPTELDVQYGIGQNLASGRIVDIGVDGLGIVGESSYPAGSEVELRFRPPDMTQEITVKAVVCFSNPNRMGVHIISFSDEQANVLEKIYEVLSQRHSR